MTAHRTARAANLPDPNRRDQQPARPSRRAPLGRGARRRGLVGWLFVLPAVYVWLATDHQAKAGSERTKEIADFDLGNKALKPT